MTWGTSWEQVAQAAGSRGLIAFQRAWSHQGPLTELEKAHLQTVFQRYPLDTTDFRVWLKQRTRQLFESSIREELHV